MECSVLRNSIGDLVRRNVLLKAIDKDRHSLRLCARTLKKRETEESYKVSIIRNSATQLRIEDEDQIAFLLAKRDRAEVQKEFSSEELAYYMRASYLFQKPHRQWHLAPDGQTGSAVRQYLRDRRHANSGPCCAFRVTPYKLKDGESLTQVAGDRGLNIQELLILNHELDPDNLDPNPTILVPQGKVSDSDRQILDNMKARRYRTYAAKSSESIQEILESRQISREEFESLNPEVDPDNLADHEIIKLPAHKYSPHEQLEMHGSLGRPQTFSLSNWVVNGFIIVSLAIGWYCVWLYRQSQRLKKAAELEGKIAAARKQYKVPEDLPTPSYLASVDEANEDVDLPDPDTLKLSEEEEEE